MISLLLQSACVLELRKKLTEDGENDHEEEEKHEDIHEGWQGLKHLTQVSGERDRARRGEGRWVAGWGPGGMVWGSSVRAAFVEMGAWCSQALEH